MGKLFDLRSLSIEIDWPQWLESSIFMDYGDVGRPLRSVEGKDQPLGLFLPPHEADPLAGMNHDVSLFGDLYSPTARLLKPAIPKTMTKLGEEFCGRGVLR